MQPVNVVLLLAFYILFFLLYFLRSTALNFLSRSSVHTKATLALTLLLFSLTIFYSVKRTTPLVKSYCEPLVKTSVMNENTPVLSSVIPQVAYPSTVLAIDGKHFGWLQVKEDSENKIMLDEQPLETHFWSDQKIYVAIPLEVSLGKHYLTIRSKVRYNGRLYPVSSNKIELTVISRSDGWDAQDDLYFQQINHMSSEGQKLNN